MKSNSTIPFIPGPPFVFGSLMVLLAMFVVILIPQITQYKSSKTSTISSDYYYTHVDLSVPRDEWNKTSSGNLSSKKNDDHDISNLETDGEQKARNRTSSQMIHRNNSHDLESVSDDCLSVSVSSHEILGRGAIGIKKEPLIVRVKTRGKGKNSACELDIPLLDESEAL